VLCCGADAEHMHRCAHCCRDARQHQVSLSSHSTLKLLDSTVWECCMCNVC